MRVTAGSVSAFLNRGAEYHSAVFLSISDSAVFCCKSLSSMDEGDDDSAFARPSESQNADDGTTMSLTPPSPDPVDTGPLTDNKALPEAEMDHDLLGFGVDAPVVGPVATSSAAESNDILDLFSSPSPQQPATSAPMVDPFADFTTTPNSSFAATEDPVTLDNGNGHKNTELASANGIFNDVFSSPSAAVTTTTSMKSSTLDPLYQESPQFGNDFAQISEKEESDSFVQQAADVQKTAPAEVQHVNQPASEAADDDNDAMKRTKQQLENLQLDCNEKDRTIKELQQALDKAASPEQLQVVNPEMERLQQALDQAQTQIQQEQQDAATKLQQVEAKQRDELADLQKQLDEANARAQGFKTDQARYRELQSLWSTEQTKRVQAEERSTTAESTVGELRKLLDQQGDDINRLRDKIATVTRESDEKVRAAEESVGRLEEVLQQQKAELTTMQEAAIAAANEPAPDAVDEMRRMKLELETKTVDLERMEKEIQTLREENARQETEHNLLKAAYDEQHRKEVALTNRLNAAKKTEAEKSGIAERLEDLLKAVTEELEVTKLDLKNAQMDKEQVENALEKLTKSSQAKLADAEAALNDERTLNEERKKKMKAFVETKVDEMRQLQTDNDALQSEVSTTSKSLVDLNNRWKQLHAQWVQSQTRNRELQRDLNRMKKDSENLHKAGDSIQMKLSRSTNETEEHKNKRLAAKHELMTVLRTLEIERELNNRLRDNIKYTFTPKALSQQQLVREALEDFEAQLLKLAQRLSVPLPPTSSSVSLTDMANGASPISNGDAATLDDDVAKLDHETQRVSQSIMLLSDNIERLRTMLEIRGSRSCASVLTELITTGAMRSSPAAIADDRVPMTGARMNAVGSQRYGHVPGGSP
ncbi:hypothetical protein MPSEU_000638800 [Mayamaea pseudoterrestris]|nr:hypothetical protein MPSEU_000638800 [Mayamaea pseudoterrestris]